MRVRTARPSDLPRVSQLAAELVRQHHALDAARFLLVDVEALGFRRTMLEMTIEVTERRSRLTAGRAR